MLELDSVHLVVAHAAAAPEDLAIAAVTLDWASVRLGYADRHPFMRWHQLHFLYGWLGSGTYTLQNLLDVRSLVAPTAEGARDQKSFLSSCAGVLTGLLAIKQSEPELQLIADVLNMSVSGSRRLLLLGYRGTYLTRALPASAPLPLAAAQVGALLSKHFDVTLGLAFPYFSSSDPGFQELGRRTISGGLTATHLKGRVGPHLYEQKQGLWSPQQDTLQALPGLSRPVPTLSESRPLPAPCLPPADDLAKLFTANLVEAMGQMLLLAQDMADPATAPPLPSFRSAAIVEAIVKIAAPSATSAEARLKALWGEVLGEDERSRLLLHVHDHLGKAQNARHQLAAVGSLRAVLLLLGERVREPATFRYAASILLRLLHVRELQEPCAALLGGVVAHLLGGGAAGIAALGSMLPALLSTLVEALEAEAAAGRPLSAPPARALAALVDRLTVSAPRELLPYLRQADPFPALPELREAAAALADARRDVSAVEQLQQFSQRASSMTPALRHRALEALRKELTAEQHALYVRGREAAGGDAALRCLPEVSEAAWRLAVLSRDLADPELGVSEAACGAVGGFIASRAERDLGLSATGPSGLQVFAGDLLALVGPLDPSVISFDSAYPFREPPEAAAGPGTVAVVPSGRSQTQGR